MTSPQFQPTEFLALIVSLPVLLFWLSHRREASEISDSPWLGLALVAFSCALVSTNVEAFVLPRLFNILEHAGYCATSAALAGFLLRTAFADRSDPGPHERTSQ